MIIIKTKEQIDGIRKSCKLLAQLFEELKSVMKSGITTKELDKFCVAYIEKHGGKPAWYRENFPGAACISINEEIIHGLPGKRIVKDGDLVSMDIGIDLDGYINFLRSGSSLDVDNMKFDTKLFDVNTNLKMTRPAFGGHLMATIVCPRFRPAMATVRPGVMQKRPYDEAGAANVEIMHPDFELVAADIETEVLDIVKAAKKMVDLIGADVIVSVGRGIAKDVEGGIALATELAELLGGVVGSSRACVDAGWISADHQVGQTGKTVHPRIYVALGISGAIQHKAGMQDSECIIAINKNETAPIFEIADYGITGDLFKVVPLLIDSIKAAKETA